MTLRGRRISGPFRTTFLYFLGGEDKLFDDAERTLDMPVSPVRLVAATDAVSTFSGRFRVRDRLPAEPESLPAVSVSLLGLDDPGRRSECLVEAIGWIAPGGRLIAIDHNAPRQRLMRLLAHLHLCVTMALGAHGGLRRLRQPLAQDLRGLGLAVERLRLLRGEVVQAVSARKPG